MGHRLSKIYTRTGDSGETGLGDGSRTRKDSPRVVALGEIDELNSAIGVLLAEQIPAKIRAVLENIQHDLFDLGPKIRSSGSRRCSTNSTPRCLGSRNSFFRAGRARRASRTWRARCAAGRSVRSSPFRKPRKSPTRRGST